MKTYTLHILFYFSFLSSLVAAAAPLPKIPKPSAQWGPNCWNLALKTAGILPYFRFTANNEMSFYSHSALCRPVSKDSLQTGDIGLIRVPKRHRREEYHGFVFLNPELVFSKNGSDQRSPYVIISREELFKIYNVPPLPVDAIRCQSLQRYLDSHPSLSPSLLKALQALTRYERDLEQWVYHGNETSDQRLKAIVTFTRKYLKSLADNADQTPRSPEADLFIQGVIRERLFSIAEQFDVLGRQDIFLELNELLKNLKSKDSQPTTPVRSYDFSHSS